MKKIIIHHRSIHHAVNSGYSRLIDHIQDAELIDGNSKFPYRIAKFVSQRMNQNKGLYDSLSFLKEIELYKLITQYKNDLKIIHYLNAERDIRYIVKNKRKFKKVNFYGTFHKPPNILKDQILDSTNLRCLDGAIAVGENQVEFLKNWLNINNVRYIPHGVDTDFFIPDISKRSINTLLFVGQHLRDFDTFNYCIPKIQEKIKDLKVNVIIRKDFIQKIKPNSAIRLHSNINDLQLKELYQNASLLFLPLRNVTACNSILEAMACGLPIITTDVGGNYGYLSKTKNIMAPLKDPLFMIDSTVDLLKNQEKLDEMGISSRNEAITLDWKVVSKKVIDFYNYKKVK